MSTQHTPGTWVAHGRAIYTPPQSGCNTVRANLTLPSGEHALVSVQRGFAPIARDDEREVNGALLLVLADAEWSKEDARKILDAALAKISE